MQTKSALVAVAFTLTLSVGLGLGGLSGVADARGSTTIKLKDDFFSPDKTTVSAGTKVKFKWAGNDRHNVTKKSGPGRSFESETTDDRGVNFAKKFKKRGRYKLICTIHADNGMKLKLKVN
jgi:plastocyanin